LYMYEVSGLGASPAILSGGEDTDTTNVNSTSHPCAAANIDVPDDSFVVCGGALNADPTSLTKHAALSNADLLTNGLHYTGVQWGIVSPAVSATRMTYTSSTSRQHVNSIAVFSNPADTTPPTLVSSTVAANGTTLTNVYSENVTHGNGLGHSLSGPNVATYVSGTGTTTLVFSLASVVLSGATPTAVYASATGTTADLAANVLASYSGQSVTNNSTQGADVTAPTVTVVAVASAVLTITFSEPTTGTTGFTLSASGGAVTLSNPAGSGSSGRTYVLSRSIGSTESLSLAYAAGDVADIATNALATITLMLVTNNVSNSGGSFPLIGSRLVY